MTGGGVVDVVTLRAGVIGAGVFGGYHANKLANNTSCSLAAIYDPDAERSEKLATLHGAKSISDLEAFFAAVDIVSIAAPAIHHVRLGEAALAAGKHVYMEKPLALEPESAERLISLAAASGLALHVGHQERQVIAATPIASLGRPKKLEFCRCGPPSGRCQDVSVVFDLMVHDLDIAAMTGLRGPTRVYAAGDPDDTVATLEFADGARASFAASRTAKSWDRRLIGEFTNCLVEIDFIAREVRTTSLLPDDKPANTVTTSLDMNDPLGANVTAFIDDTIRRSAKLQSKSISRGYRQIMEPAQEESLALLGAAEAVSMAASIERARDELSITARSESVTI